MTRLHYPAFDSEKKAQASWAASCELQSIFEHVDVVAFCDGSVNVQGLPKTQLAGRAVVLRDCFGNFSVKGDCVSVSSSLQAELAAVVLALESTKAGQSVAVMTDCQTLVSMGNRLVADPAINLTQFKCALGRRLGQLLVEREVFFHWVAGHAGIMENEICDKVAKACRKERSSKTLVFDYFDVHCAKSQQEPASLMELTVSVWNRLVPQLRSAALFA